MGVIGRPAVVFLVLAVAVPATAARAGISAAASPHEVVIGPGVEAALAGAATAPVVILLDVDPALARIPDRAALRREVGRAQDRALAGLPSPDFVLRSRPQHAPILAGEMGHAGLERLRRLAGVRRVDLDLPGGGALAQSVPLVRADALRALGFDGTGLVVGEVDSGVDTDHPDLAGAVVGQACTCVTGGGCCPNGTAFQTGPGSAEDDAGHGTLVAGVMTSDGHVAPVGVAPGVGIVAVKVTDRTDHTCCMSDVTSALDWILANRPDVAAINVSVVSDALYPGDCDTVNTITAGMAFVIDALRAAGIPVFAAAGNNATGGAMASPACVHNAVSMGATYDATLGPIQFAICTDSSTFADQVTCFSDSDASTDLFAPGCAITTSALGGGIVGGAAGTSFAAPHATACAALLRQAHPALRADAIENAFKATGRPVTDPKNGLSFPRIDCLAAVQVGDCPDADGDGFWVAGPNCPGPPFSDCDDGSASRHPGATESCNHVDDDCDGLVDEGFDADGDGLPACDDNCPGDANPGQEDRDHDAEGDACDRDDGVIEIRVDPQQVRWQQESGFDAFDLYRGDLRDLVDTDHDGAAEDYGSCFAENLAAPAFNDPEAPPPGSGFFYLVTGRSAAGIESDLGRASSGAPRPNRHDCASVFGVPPVIQALEATASEQLATCDVTSWMLGRLCTLGVPGAVAHPGMAVQAGYTGLRIAIPVLDPDDVPPQAPEVIATLAPPSGSGFEVPLFDDGSAVRFGVTQRSSDAGLDCTLDPQSCVCATKIFAVDSGDATAADTDFTRVVALVAPSLPALVQDCIMEADRRLPMIMSPGVPLTIQVTARDAQGHATTSPWSAPIVPGAGSYVCTGDPCGCCLLTSADPVTDCAGLPGITSPDFPDGLCLAF
jgi:subtilisin family serine protease